MTIFAPISLSGGRFFSPPPEMGTPWLSFPLQLPAFEGGERRSRVPVFDFLSLVVALVAFRWFSADLVTNPALSLHFSLEDGVGSLSELDFIAASRDFAISFLCHFIRSISLRLDAVICTRRLIGPETKVLCISPLHAFWFVVEDLEASFSPTTTTTSLPNSQVCYYSSPSNAPCVDCYVKWFELVALDLSFPGLVFLLLRISVTYGPMFVPSGGSFIVLVRVITAICSSYPVVFESLDVVMVSYCPFWQFGHGSSISETLPNCISRVLVLRVGCLFLPLPRFQVLYSSFDNLIASYALRSLVCPLGTFGDSYLAPGRIITALCSPFTTVCRSIFGVFRALALLLWQREVFMAVTSFHPVNRVWLDFYCPVPSSVEFVFLSDFSLALNGFTAGGFRLKTTGISIFVLSKGSAKWGFITSAFVAGYVIENCALAAVSISGCRPLYVLSNSQGFDSPFSSIGVEIRGLLSDSSSSSVLFAVIYPCCISLLSCFCCLFSHNGLLPGSLNFCCSHRE